MIFITLAPPHSGTSVWRLGLAAAAALAAAAPLAGCRPNQAPPTAQAPAQLSPDQVGLLLQTLDAAPSHGFSQSRFGAPQIRQLLQSGDADERQRGQQRLVGAIVAYARAQHGLALAKAALDPNWGYRRESYDAQRELSAAVAQNRLKDWVEALPPPFPGYQALRQGYQAYLNAAAAGGWGAIPDGEPLRVGSQGPRVQALRARLALEDPAVNKADADHPFDQALAQVVTAYQQRNGLLANGVVDAATLKALNVPAQTRVLQIRANLERLRWAPRTPAADRVEVNSVGGTFDLFLDGQPALHMLAAAGKPGDETPILTSTIASVVLNPPWRVPDSIADKELFPKNAQDHGYFEREGFAVQPPGQGVKLIQKPGPKNALGQVKFQFANDYGVYLHDTPAKAAFLRQQRSVSHGCVRLEHALQFAETLLQREPGWSVARVNETVSLEDTTEVKLSRPVQVSLFYWTAIPAGGRIGFRDDVYGWDAELVRLLDAGGSSQA